MELVILPPAIIKCHQRNELILHLIHHHLKRQSSQLQEISVKRTNIYFILYFYIIDEDFNPLIPKDEEEKPLSIVELKMRYMRNYLLSKKDEYCQDRQLS